MEIFGFIFLTSQRHCEERSNLNKIVRSESFGHFNKPYSRFSLQSFCFCHTERSRRAFLKKTKRISTTIGAKKQTINIKTNI